MRIKFIQKIIDIFKNKTKRELKKQVNFLSDRLQFLSERLQYIESKGGSMPLSPQYKQNNIREYAQEYNCKVMVETGTYLGDTVYALKNDFEKIYTIELSKKLFEDAKKRFSGESQIYCYQGNSKDILPDILKELNSMPIFWLDAHYSAGITAKGDKNTPIIEELEIIFKNLNKMVILIDDAREFGTEPDYPTIFKLKNFVKRYYPNAEFEIYNDIIRIVIL